MNNFNKPDYSARGPFYVGSAPLKISGRKLEPGSQLDRDDIARLGEITLRGMIQTGQLVHEPPDPTKLRREPMAVTRSGGTLTLDREAIEARHKAAEEKRLEGEAERDRMLTAEAGKQLAQDKQVASVQDGIDLIESATKPEAKVEKDPPSERTTTQPLPRDVKEPAKKADASTGDSGKATKK